MKRNSVNSQLSINKDYTNSMNQTKNSNSISNNKFVKESNSEGLKVPEIQNYSQIKSLYKNFLRLTKLTPSKSVNWKGTKFGKYFNRDLAKTLNKLLEVRLYINLIFLI